MIPFSALLMACGNLLGNDLITDMSNITLMMIVGIVVQALAECFISPRYLEYFSLQAPKGEEGMYLGFSHLHSFLSSIFGFWSGGESCLPNIVRILLCSRHGQHGRRLAQMPIIYGITLLLLV